MAERLTRNVSLPARQNAFVEAMVAGGRYRTASEVVREGLRLLEEVEHRRLFEAWLLEQAGGASVGRKIVGEECGPGGPPLDPDLVERVRVQIRAVLEEVAVGQAAVAEVAVEQAGWTS